uniref:Uncharacterized protein n=1 Tax=virus sp. ct1Uu26 TaxID=2826789 RepID=A0A8S5R8Z9_9VIRU|nr:MAG TPA: hypothetical protein [virus sp. ct1Uu26]DAS13423.1 MAG TPA: hypothetical protein [Caudoviricetes sp.]DAW66731.1 MAG TPA: hypothetical protein [Caudoviricetes sp.]DAX26129.1 MAG TPA: hypothetical protein [Caudoviricetes sp.]
MPHFKLFICKRAFFYYHGKKDLFSIHDMRWQALEEPQ